MVLGFRRGRSWAVLAQVSHGVAVKYSQDCIVFSHPTGAGGCTSTVAHLHGWQIDVGYWSFPPLLDLSTELLDCTPRLMAGFPQGKESKRTKQKLQCLLWSSLGSHTLSLPPYSVGLTQSALIQCERRAHWGQSTERHGPFGALKKLWNFNFSPYKMPMDSHHYVYCVILAIANCDMTGFFLFSATLLLHCLW